MAWIRVDTTSSEPVYEQIVRQVTYAVARGEYRPGDRLPSVRQLATELLVNPNTVAKAFRELERNGLTYPRKGDGVFVAERAGEICERLRREEVVGRIAEALRDAAHSGLPAQELRRIIEMELRTVAREESRTVRSGEEHGKR